MMSDRFIDRADAGRRLAGKLRHLAASDPVVLALPRGGVPVALEIARALGAPLDLPLVRKIGTPGQPELAAGAVVDGEAPRTVINQRIVEVLAISPDEIEQAAARAIAEIERRRKLWLHGRRPLSLAGRTAIIVDDGVATGASIEVALRALGDAGVRRRIVAAPVAPSDTAEALRKLCDEAVFLKVEPCFLSVGAYYVDFHQLDDGEMTSLLDRGRAVHGSGRAAARGPLI